MGDSLRFSHNKEMFCLVLSQANISQPNIYHTIDISLQARISRFPLLIVPIASTAYRIGITKPFKSSTRTTSSTTLSRTAITITSTKILLHTVLIPRLHILSNKLSNRCIDGFQLLQTIRGYLDGISLGRHDGNVIPWSALGCVIDNVWLAILAVEDDTCSA